MVQRTCYLRLLVSLEVLLKSKVFTKLIFCILAGTITSCSAGGGTALDISLPPSALSLSSVTPGAGSIAGGTTITLSGSGFKSGATVTIGGTSCSSVTFVSATSLTCITPPHTAGAVDVTTTNLDTGTATLSASYTFTSAVGPSLSSISPSSGSVLGGTSVTITGINFSTGATAKIGGTICGSPSVSSTQITCTTGSRGYGTVTAVVTNTDLQATSENVTFTYDATGTTTFSTLNTNIFSVKCATCHTTDNPLKGSYSLSTWAGAATSPRVIPGDPTNSLMYQKVLSGAMPGGGNPNLTTPEINQIYEWILGGALDN